MTKHYLKYPSISKVLKATESEESKQALKRWAASIGEAEAENVRSAAFTRGRLIDSNVADYYVTGDCTNPILKTYLSQFKIIDNEQECYSDTHKYYGRFDNILLKGEKYIINDFKGSGKPKQKQWLNDNPVQLAAYYFAVIEQGRKIDYGQLSYMVDGADEIQRFVFAPSELKVYFNEFLERLDLYNRLQVALH